VAALLHTDVAALRGCCCFKRPENYRPLPQPVPPAQVQPPQPPVQLPRHPNEYESTFMPDKPRIWKACRETDLGVHCPDCNGASPQPASLNYLVLSGTCSRYEGKQIATGVWQGREIKLYTVEGDAIPVEVDDDTTTTFGVIRAAVAQRYGYQYRDNVFGRFMDAMDTFLSDADTVTPHNIGKLVVTRFSEDNDRKGWKDCTLDFGDQSAVLLKKDFKHIVGLFEQHNGVRKVTIRAEARMCYKLSRHGFTLKYVTPVVTARKEVL